MAITSTARADVVRRFRFVDDFVDNQLDPNWDIVSNTVNGTATILNGDVANAAEGIGNVQLFSGASGGDAIDMQWEDGAATGGFVTGGSRPLFRARINVIGPLADIEFETGLTNLGVSMVARVIFTGAANWMLEVSSPVGGSSDTVDTGIAAALGAADISIEVIPATQVVVVINGSRFVHSVAADIGRGSERCRPFARCTHNGNAGGTVVVDYIEVQGNRP